MLRRDRPELTGLPGAPLSGSATRAWPAPPGAGPGAAAGAGSQPGTLVAPSWQEDLDPLADSLTPSLSQAPGNTPSASELCDGDTAELVWSDRLEVPPASERGSCAHELKGVDTGACVLDDLDVSNPLWILDLDHERGLSKLDLYIVSGIDAADFATVEVMFGLAMQLASHTRDLITWSRCMVDEGEARCIKRVVSGQTNRTYVELRDRGDAPSFAAWQGWVTTAWCTASWIPTWWGLGVALLTTETRPSDCTRAVFKHGYLLVNTRSSPRPRKTFPRQLALFKSGDDMARAGVIMDLAVTLVHELSHTCNEWWDPAGKCRKADLLESVYQYALASRFPTVGRGSGCFRKWNSGGGLPFKVSGPPCAVQVVPELFGNEGGGSFKNWSDCE